MKTCLAALLVFCALDTTVGAEEGRLWSTKKGIKVYAELAEDKGDYLILKKDTGDLAKVRVDSLSDEDQRYVAAKRGGTEDTVQLAAAAPAVDPFAGVALDPSRIRYPTTFTYSDPEATQVEISGDFSGWKPLAMEKSADGGWAFTVDLAPGQHGYKFRVNGGKWVFDPNNAERMTSGKYENSAITVTAPEP